MFLRNTALKSKENPLYIYWADYPVYVISCNPYNCTRSRQLSVQSLPVDSNLQSKKESLKTLYHPYHNPSPTFSKFTGGTSLPQGSFVFKSTQLTYKLSKTNCTHLKRTFNDLTNAKHSHWGKIVKRQENSLARGKGRLRASWLRLASSSTRLTCPILPPSTAPFRIRPSGHWVSALHQII